MYLYYELTISAQGVTLIGQQVVSAIGAPEDDLLAAFTNVKKIDGEGAIALVQAAEAAGVQQFVMVSKSRRPVSVLTAACCCRTDAAGPQQ